VGPPLALLWDMRAKANFLGHAIHPMLVAFPLGLLSLVWVFDIVHLASGHVEWAQIAFSLLTCGIIGAVVAALFGFIDFLKIPRGTRAYGVALKHLGVNLSAAGLFVVSWIIRVSQTIPRSGVAAFIVALAGFVVLLVGGWLGGELLERLGMGVYEDANLDAPSSVKWGQRERGQKIPVHREPEPTP
jgi:uncharacterized membrane protein